MPVPTFHLFNFTVNNYVDVNIAKIDVLFVDGKASWIVRGFEVAPTTGMKHIQGALWMSEKHTKQQVIRLLSPKNAAHAFVGVPGPAKGPAYWLDYCSKEDVDAVIRGDQPTEEQHVAQCPRQGHRSDIDDSVRSIVEGSTTVDEILIEHPQAYHMYGRTLMAVEDIVMRKTFRTAMTTCEWFWGATGTGKSHRAYDKFDPTTCYDWVDDNGWWDGYRQQEVVIMNEFRGQLKYSELLTLIDKWPKKVRRRHREPMPFTSKHIIITSSLPPEEVYHNLSSKDSLDQLMRRIVVTQLENGDHTICN